MNARLSFEEIAQEFTEWSIPAFDKATALSSACKLHEESFELMMAIEIKGLPPFNTPKVKEEYADCLFTILDSISRAGISLLEIKEAMIAKLEVNKKRTWKANDNNTYSHID